MRNPLGLGGPELGDLGGDRAGVGGGADGPPVRDGGGADGWQTGGGAGETPSHGQETTARPVT